MASKKRRWIEVLAQRGGAIELLCLPGMLFGCIARLRSEFYDRRLLRVQEVGVPVISIGNITAGGTGKTPMVALVVRLLIKAGYQPGILSRGYGAKPDAPNDEALELARLLGDVDHVQDPQRVRGATRLVNRGADVIVMDDGFQHRRLHRDLDLVLVDATRPFGLPVPNGGGTAVKSFLPRGLLREGLGALRRADLIVLTRTNQVDEESLQKLETELSRSSGGVSLLRSQHQPVRVLTPDGPQPITCLDKLEVDLVSGIGNPEGFEKTVRDEGALIMEHRKFEDHHDFVAADLKGLGERPMLTTMKDAVKIEGIGGPHPWVLEVALEILQGSEALDELLAALPKPTAATNRDALRGGLVG